MLKLCRDISELDFLPADPFGIKISAFALTYGFSYDFARFYVQDDSAAVSVIDGNMTLWCGENADYGEIREFISFMGFVSLQCSEKVMKELGFPPDDASFIVKYGGDFAEKPNGFISVPDYRQVYELLTDSGFEMGDYGSFLSDIGSRINKGTAAFGGISEPSGLSSCAFRLFSTESGNLLGAVATDKASRGRGLASSLVPYMAYSDKPSFLFCRNDSLLDFYKNCGFSEWGRWAFTERGLL